MTNPSKSENHRARNGDIKREETRARILDATRRVCEKSRGAQPSIDDIIALARISRSTFYNHFDTIEKAMAALGEAMTRQHLAQQAERFQGVFQEQWQIQSVGLRVTLMRAVSEPVWADMLVRTGAWAHDGAFSNFMLEQLVAGRESGEFQILDNAASLDQLRGLLMRSFMSLQQGVSDPDRYIDGAVYAVLQAFGYPQAQCVEGTEFSRTFLAR